MHTASQISRDRVSIADGNRLTIGAQPMGANFLHPKLALASRLGTEVNSTVSSRSAVDLPLGDNVEGPFLNFSDFQGFIALTHTDKSVTVTNRLAKRYSNDLRRFAYYQALGQYTDYPRLKMRIGFGTVALFENGENCNRDITAISVLDLVTAIKAAAKRRHAKAGTSEKFFYLNQMPPNIGQNAVQVWGETAEWRLRTD